jgi:hypothetical protein
LKLPVVPVAAGGGAAYNISFYARALASFGRQKKSRLRLTVVAITTINITSR